MKESSLREMIEGNWKELSGKVRHEWGKLTHNDVEQVKGNLEVLAGKIEERYGTTKAEAKKQIEQWVHKIFAHQDEPSQSDRPAN